jgi:putative transposase
MGVAAQRVYDTDLSDDAWTLIEAMLPVPRFGGPTTHNVRAVLNAIFYLLRTGCQWRLLPREFHVWGTVITTFGARATQGFGRRSNELFTK